MTNESQEEKLKDLFYDPSSGFTGISAFTKKVKKQYPSISNKIIKDFYEKQNVNQLYYPRTTNNSYLPIFSRLKNSYQIDLAFLPSLASSNKNFNTILTCININTRKAYAYKSKNKTQDTILDLLKQFLKDAKHVSTITSDNGSEFINQKVKKFFEYNHIEHYTCEPGDHNKLGKIERFNRTLKAKLQKYMAYTGKPVWYDVLDDIVNNYNNTVHSVIKVAPNEADNSEKIENQIIQDSEMLTQAIIDNRKPISVGDYVRVKLSKSKLEKENINYSEEVYKVIEVNNHSVKLENVDTGKKKYGSVKISDLLKIPYTAESVDNKINTDEIKQVKADHKQKMFLQRPDININQNNIQTGKRERKPSRVIRDLQSGETVAK